jgi:hypothetical protein
MMPTASMPPCSAARACASAKSRPFVVGSDAKTTVQPLRPVGHCLSVGGGRFLRLGAGVSWGPVPVGVLPVETVVLSGGAPNVEVTGPKGDVAVT